MILLFGFFINEFLAKIVIYQYLFSLSFLMLSLKANWAKGHIKKIFPYLPCS